MTEVNLIALAESPAHDETARIMQICNACRYCEGFCAVFPAMENGAYLRLQIRHIWLICVTIAGRVITPANMPHRTNLR